MVRRPSEGTKRGIKNCHVRIAIPTGSMYGIYACTDNKNQPNVCKYTSPMNPMGLLFRENGGQ